MISFWGTHTGNLLMTALIAISDSYEQGIYKQSEKVYN